MGNIFIQYYWLESVSSKKLNYKKMMTLYVENFYHLTLHLTSILLEESESDFEENFLES